MSRKRFAAFVACRIEVRFLCLYGIRTVYYIGINSIPEVSLFLTYDVGTMEYVL